MTPLETIRVATVRKALRDAYIRPLYTDRRVNGFRMKLEMACEDSSRAREVFGEVVEAAKVALAGLDYVTVELALLTGKAPYQTGKPVLVPTVRINTMETV